mgnify:CR=1 FL=1
MVAWFWRMLLTWGPAGEPDTCICEDFSLMFFMADVVLQFFPYTLISIVPMTTGLDSQ